MGNDGGGTGLSPSSAIFLSVPFIMISAAGRFFYMLINFYAILHNLPTCRERVEREAGGGRRGSGIARIIIV